MKINIIGPTCVGKTTVAEVIEKRNNWRHFDLDLIFVDGEYLVQTKVFRLRQRADCRKAIDDILNANKNWVIEGIYAVDKIFKEADLIIFINLSLMVSLKWQWKRYLTDKYQRDTYGFFNNVILSGMIINQYLRKCDRKDFNNELVNYICKYKKVLEKYRGKLKVITNIDDLERLRKSGSFEDL